MARLDREVIGYSHNLRRVSEIDTQFMHDPETHDIVILNEVYQPFKVQPKHG